nr:uncharacterized protein LOC127303879 [Lolium perenne]
MTEPVDEVAMMLAGSGQPHGRPACLAGGFKPQRNFTQIKATLPSGSYATSSRTTCRSRVEVDTQLEEAYAVAYEEYLEKVKEHDLVKDAYVQVDEQPDGAVFIFNLPTNLCFPSSSNELHAVRYRSTPLSAVSLSALYVVM